MNRAADSPPWTDPRIGSQAANIWRASRCGLGKIEQRIQIEDPVFRKDVRFLGKGRLHDFRRQGRGRTGVAGPDVDQRRAQDVEHREENAVERFSLVLFEDQVVDVRQRQLGGITGIDRAALGPDPEHFLGGEIGIDDVSGQNAQSFQNSR